MGFSGGGANLKHAQHVAHHRVPRNTLAKLDGRLEQGACGGERSGTSCESGAADGQGAVEQ